MIKKFNPEKTRIAYNIMVYETKSNKLTEFLWLAQEIPCPEIKANRDRFINTFTKTVKKHFDINVTREQIEKDFINICGLIPCTCNGTNKIQRIMHPDFWEEVKENEWKSKKNKIHC